MADDGFCDELEDEPAGVVGNIVRVVKAGASKIFLTQRRERATTRRAGPARRATPSRRGARRVAATRARVSPSTNASRRCEKLVSAARRRAHFAASALYMWVFHASRPDEPAGSR